MCGVLGVSFLIEQKNRGAHLWQGNAYMYRVHRDGSEQRGVPTQRYHRDGLLIFVLNRSCK